MSSISTLIAVLIWPAVTIVIFLCVRRQLNKILKKLPHLLDRTEGIEYAGFKIDCPPLGSQELMNIGGSDLYSRIYESTLILAEENTIKEQIKSAKLSNEQAFKALIYQVAHKNFIISFLQIERLILPPQLAVLEFLREEFPPVPDQKLMNFCDKLHKTEYDYKSCIGFLINKNLIQITIDGFIISNFGREYLIFRAKIGGFSKKPESWRDKVQVKAAPVNEEELSTNES